MPAWEGTMSHPLVDAASTANVITIPVSAVRIPALAGAFKRR